MQKKRLRVWDWDKRLNQHTKVDKDGFAEQMPAANRIEFASA
jgi:hypothetical protein